MNLRGINPEPNTVWPPRPRSLSEHPVVSASPFTYSSLHLSNSGVEPTPKELREYWTNKQTRVQQEFVNRLTRQLEYSLKQVPNQMPKHMIAVPEPSFRGFETRDRSSASETAAMRRPSGLEQRPSKLAKRADTRAEEAVIQNEQTPESPGGVFVDSVDTGLNLLLSLAT
eukprot:TRINITY_DN6426_c0_g1_i3.p1 TRINITY_DN6426_c0_g1~~TRINITY_DN6426_c0_g1_i3.p1  ORF type:complete len:170 (-),score=22.32 TRINITY_DN6426_c0_g1_i3:75-584(-)